MKFKFLSALVYAQLQEASDNWNALVKMAEDLEVAEAKSLNPDELLNRLTESILQKEVDANNAVQAKVDQLEKLIASQKAAVSALEEENKTLKAQPAETPAKAVGASDPVAPSADGYEPILNGKEDFWEGVRKVGEAVPVLRRSIQ